MEELAEDEMRNFGKVWAMIIVSLSYCFVIGKVTPKGFIRLVAILPIIALFIALPLNLTSIHLCGFTAFMITWLANFKLLLFAFGQPPLCSDPPISFAHFLTVACLPIQTETSTKSQNKQNPRNPSEMSLWVYIIKCILVGLCLQIYNNAQQLPRMVLWITYFLHIFFVLDLVLASLAKASKILLGLQVEPQFNTPLLSTSLQEFWGRRWNLMVTSIMRPTVFQPVRDLTLRRLGPLPATQLAIMAAFVVSGTMHELIIFYLGRMRPTLEVMSFFLLHGVCVCLEITVKYVIAKRWRVPWWVSCPVTLGVVVATASWLFLPPLLRAGLGTKGIHEYTVAGSFVRNIGSVTLENIQQFLDLFLDSLHCFDDID